MSEEVIKLYKPDLEMLATTEVSFSPVLETRKSIWEYGETPLSSQQLGEFLYRCARVKHHYQTEQGEIAISVDLRYGQGERILLNTVHQW